jgi:hypothetical protein
MSRKGQSASLGIRFVRQLFPLREVAAQARVKLDSISSLQFLRRLNVPDFQLTWSCGHRLR